MTGQEYERRCNLAVCERNLSGGRCSKGGRYARNDIDLDAGFAQRLHLLASAAEDEWVSALQANHLQTQQRILNKQRIDFALACALPSATFADVLDSSCRRNECSYPCSHKLVVQNDVCTFQNFQRFQGKQLRISRTCAH